MKKALFVLTIVILAILVSADQAVSCGNGGMGGMGGGMGGMMMGDMDSSMVMVADDGSILIVDGGMGMMGSWNSSHPTLTNISSSGTDRWQMPFSSGWPMMLATNGDLVVVVVSSGGSGMWIGGQGAGQSWLIGIDLATGNPRWQINLDNSMASYPQFSDDGSQFYVTVSASDGQMYGGPMGQGGWGSSMTTKLIAVGRTGNVIWERDLGGQGGGWTP